MATTVRQWDESYILSLPLEDDRWERKGSKLLDLNLPDVTWDKVCDELAKQLSAFANTGGGAIIYGVSDDGHIDGGGISQVLKGRQSTKDWLESIIPTLTEFEIVGFNVREIPPSVDSSLIQPGKALYVIEVPDSERAPHQSKRDRLYYVRLGARSQPASHKLIEDIRNRAKHPDVAVVGVRISTVVVNDRGSYQQLELTFDWTLANVGRIKASNCCVVSTTDYGNFGPERGVPQTVQVRSTDSRTWFWELQYPIYPGMEASFRAMCYVTARVLQPSAGMKEYFVQPPEKGIPEQSIEAIVISWKLFADSAPPKSGKQTIGELGFRTARWRT
jgi:hypothetical protein